MQANYYPINKNRFILMAVFFALLAIGSVLGLNLLLENEGGSSTVYIPRIVIAFPIIGVLGVGFALINIFSTAKGLTLTNDGLTYNVGMNKLGPIAWTGIIRAEKKKYLLNNFIVVHLKDPAAFIATRKGLNKRIYVENQTTHGSPLVLNATQLNTDFDALLNDINSRVKGVN